MTDKSCSTIHILGRENHFRKDLVEFWHWKWTLNIEKCRFSRVFNQTVLQGIKKSSGHVYWDVKSYWISYASLWNSRTVITLTHNHHPLCFCKIPQVFDSESEVSDTFINQVWWYTHCKVTLCKWCMDKQVSAADAIHFRN